MSRADVFREALEAGDVAMLRAAFAKTAPHLPQPKTDAEAEITMHHARTQAESVTFAKRAYSYAWLTERGLPNGLPDRLKPSAMRLYPRVVEGVGISVKAGDPGLKPAAKLIERAMSNAVEDAYAEGVTDPVFVRGRMEAARIDERRRLFGAFG